MSFDGQKLYELLPAVYRIRDAKHGEPLRALLEVIAGEVALVKEDLEQLYDDLFIETCAEWVVPYIGDLIGARGIHDLENVVNGRAQVANTLSYRRRKGTSAVLEALARDVTGWHAHATEFFQTLATTQHLNHARPQNLYAPDLRRWEPLERINSPFDSLARTADVRRVKSGRGRHNIPNVGVSLWRLRAYPLTRSPAFRVDARRYLFGPLGNDTQLFTKPEPEAGVAHVSGPLDAPLPISRRVLHERLDDYYGPGKSFSVEVAGETVPPERISACDLSTLPDGRWAHEPPDTVAVDPVLGRILFPQDAEDVTVTFHYGFTADLGGGEYDRAATLGDAVPLARTTAPNLRQALRDAATGVVEVTDGARHEGDLQIDASGRFELRAADGRRPLLVGDLRITGADDAEVTLNGVVISGRLHVSGELRRLRLLHCTLVPGISLTTEGEAQDGSAPSLIVDTSDAEVRIDRCVLGRLRVAGGNRAWISNSIVDALAETNVAYAATDGAKPGGRLRVENSTVVGRVRTTFLELASNGILLGTLRSERRQGGCARFSYLPPGSLAPRRYRCRPENGDEAVRMRPQFSSLRYGDPAYGRLSRRCAAEILRGADDEAEMGAFHDVYGPQRETNLRLRLDEYLRFGLEAGILYAD
jgi:hypothetical protein